MNPPSHVLAALKLGLRVTSYNTRSEEPGEPEEVDTVLQQLIKLHPRL